MIPAAMQRRADGSPYLHRNMDHGYLVPNMPDPPKAKLIRALERRFGKSMMPYRFHGMALHVWRITDTESGSWIEARIDGKGRHRRLVVTREHDGSTL